MFKQQLSKTTKYVYVGIKKHSPEILTGIGIAGFVTTVLMAVKATPKALSLIEEKKDELEKDTLTKKEIIKVAAPCYIPTVITGSLSALCIIGASSTNLRRNAALATAYKISESSLKSYKDKAIEMFGDKKAQSIQEEVTKDKITRNPIRDVIITEKGGNTTCYDVISGRYFKSDRTTIDRIVNELNRKMRSEMYITLNEFYYELGLDGIKLGDELGWNIDKGYIEISYSSHLDANDTPCMVIDYDIAPTYDYI